MDNEDNENKFIQMLKQANDKHMIYMGDFNYPDIDWFKLTANNRDSKFLKMTQENFLTQHIDFPTRGENFLNLVFSSEVDMVQNAENLGKVGTSDHDMVGFDMNVYIERTESINRISDFARADWTQINRDLSKIEWEEKFKHLSANEAWEYFKETVESAAQRIYTFEEM